MTVGARTTRPSGNSATARPDSSSRISFFTVAGIIHVHDGVRNAAQQQPHPYRAHLFRGQDGERPMRQEQAGEHTVESGAMCNDVQQRTRAGKWHGSFHPQTQKPLQDPPEDCAQHPGLTGFLLARPDNESRHLSL